MGTMSLGPEWEWVGGSASFSKRSSLTPCPTVLPLPPAQTPLPGPAPPPEKPGRCVWVSVLLVPLLPSPLPSLSCSTCNYPFYQGERPCNSLVEALTRQRGCFQVRKEKGNPARIGNLIHQASLDRPH